MKQLLLLSKISVWVSASLLAVLPIVVAADFGGVLWWTQYVAALAILAAALLAIPSLFLADSAGLSRQHYPVLILLLWCGFAWLQTVPMFAGLVGLLSRGSKLAYRDWIEPLLGAEGVPTFFPISIDPAQSAHSVAAMMLVVCVVWTATQVFVSCAKIGMLLNVLAIGAALHACFGIARQVYPEMQVFGAQLSSTSFGCFVNRNNAALLMNIGLAASLGLLAWRLAALTGMEVDDKDFEIGELLSLLNDRASIVGVISAALCLCGLLVCGSRGGLAALVVGSLLALGWVRQQRGSKTVPVVGLAILVCVAILLIPLNLDMQSIQRLEIFSGDDTSTLLRDARFPHWQDGMQTAKAYFPAGSGLGSYAYAYLPYQHAGSDKWFHHADNLWLELLVEQGLPGLIFTVLIFWLMIRTLLRMNHSVDPIDHGLRVAGWFMVGVLLVSQFFDFGLIIPSNLIAVAVYVSATLARATAAGLNVVDGKRDLFSSKYATFWSGGLAGLVILLTCLATNRLGSDAHLESAAKQTAATLDGAQNDPERLSQLATKLRSTPGWDRSPVTLDLLSKVEYAQARLVEATATNPQSASQAQAAYQDTDLMRRRTNWYAGLNQNSRDQASNPSSLASSPEPAGDLYQSVLDLSAQSLRRLPLGMEARAWQIYLDFIHQDQTRSEQAIAQLAEIYQGNPLILERLGSHAAVAGDVDLATNLWRSVLELDPSRALRILDLVQERSDIDLLAVLPSDSTVFRRITRRMIERGTATDEVLQRATVEIDCEDCETKKQKSDCHRLAADIAYQLKDMDVAFQQLVTAIELTPANSKLHLSYVQRLRESGQNSAARVAARRARQQFPDDKRFRPNH